MNITTSFLETIQHRVESHLNAQTVFKDIPVFSHQESNLENCLNEFIQSGIGLCIVILNPIPLRIIPAIDVLAFEDIQLRVQVIESPCTNTSKITVLSVAEHISAILHNFRPMITSWKGWITLDELHPWTEIKDPQKTGRYILEINFHIRGSTMKFNSN